MKSEKIQQDKMFSDDFLPIIRNMEKNISKFQSLLPTRPNTYLPKIAEWQYELGSFYHYECKDSDSAETLLLQALENYEKYTGRRSCIVSDKIKTMQRLVKLYQHTQRPELCERMLLRILEQQTKLAQKYWWIYLEDVAITQWELANLYVDMKRFADAEQMYLAALTTRSEFENEDPDRYWPGTAQCYRSLGRLYEFHLHQPSQATHYYQKSTAIRQSLA